VAANKLIPHHPEELSKLLALATGTHSILEIGSRYGETLRQMALRMDRKSQRRVVSIDLPGEPPWGEIDSQERLQGVIDGLADIGVDAHLFLGNSRDPNIVRAVHRLAPFDLVFIDGDHTYDGARADWLNYGPLGKIVVFHDIIKPQPGERQELQVWRLWSEIEGDKEAFQGEGSKMGIGIWRSR